MSILGILVGPPLLGEEVVILLQGCGPHLILCELLVLLPLTPLCLHITLEEWA